jgi:hypothetical protein
MGSIIHIWRDHKRWKLTGEKAKLKETHELILKVEYGDADWDYEGSFPLIMWIRESIYNNVKENKYKINKDLFRRDLIIEDEKGNKIPPFKEDFIY